MQTHWIDSLGLEHKNTASEVSLILSQVWETLFSYLATQSVNQYHPGIY